MYIKKHLTISNDLFLSLWKLSTKAFRVIFFDVPHQVARVWAILKYFTASYESPIILNSLQIVKRQT